MSKFKISNLQNPLRLTLALTKCCTVTNIMVCRNSWPNNFIEMMKICDFYQSFFSKVYEHSVWISLWSAARFAFGLLYDLRFREYLRNIERCIVMQINKSGISQQLHRCAVILIFIVRRMYNLSVSEACPQVWPGPNLNQLCAGSQFLTFMTILDTLIRSQETVSQSCNRVRSVDPPEHNYDFIVVGGKWMNLWILVLLICKFSRILRILILKCVSPTGASRKLVLVIWKCLKYFPLFSQHYLN